ncbi:MAG: DNA-3-methyladenine glycosylase family protein [Solirubrobacterales bacterium]
MAASPHARLAASDPVIAELIADTGEMTLERRRRGRPAGDAYGTLLRTVIGQQLSAKAAFTIHGRVLELYGGEHPSPQALLATPEEDLRGCGLSGRKVEYVRSLAEHVRDGELQLDRLDALSDSEVVTRIVAVRGFGEWSAQMFLMFFLERPDVLPTGDLGIRKAVQMRYELDQLPGPDELERIAEPWRPQRTLACLHLWESLSNTPVAERS